MTAATALPLMDICTWRSRLLLRPGARQLSPCTRPMLLLLLLLPMTALLAKAEIEGDLGTVPAAARRRKSGCCDESACVNALAVGVPAAMSSRRTSMKP